MTCSSSSSSACMLCFQNLRSMLLPLHLGCRQFDINAWRWVCRRDETSGVHVIPRMQHEVTEVSAVKGGAFLSALLQR